MQTKLAAALLAAAMLCGSALADGLLPERVVKAIEARVGAGQYPVVVIGVIDGGNSEVRGFGKLPDGTQANGGTVFEIGSVTKTFTATLLADAVKTGQLRLDQPVEDLLPGWKIPARDGRKITLGDIARQRSGLPRMPGNLKPADLENPFQDYGRGKLQAFLAGYDLPRDPGAQYEYSNLGFALLGTALAEHAGMTYGELLQRKILTPLGMNDSAAVTTDAMRARLAPGHNEQGKSVKNWDFDAFAPAGAIRSTADDMLRYLKANMRAAPGSAMALAQQPEAEVGAGSKIGLAWMTEGKSGIVWHNGMTGGYASFLGFSADRKHGVVVLTDAAVSLDDLGFATLNAEAPITPVQSAVTLPGSALDEVGGDYKLASGLVIHVFREGGQLYLRAEGQQALPVYASGPSDFFMRIAPISVTFTRDAAGKVDGMVLHQNGDHPASRIAADNGIALDAKTLADYVGVYDFGALGELVVTLEEGRLTAKLAAQPAFAIYPSAKDAFFYKVVEAKLSFERDAAGKVVAVVLHQNGHDLRALRKP